MDTIFVLGLGGSLKFFDRTGPTIGVNDIYKYFKTDYVVCVDYPERFSPDRLKTIKDCSPSCFFSQLSEWRGDNFKQIKIKPIREKGKVLPKINLDGDTLYHSILSPFVAVQIGYKLGYKNIILYGVDLDGHKTLSKESNLKIISADFKKLKEELNKKGVNLFVGHRSSKLYGILPASPQA